jgi:tripartite-type tricarboxylate transporter receptor subunit TctC
MMRKRARLYTRSTFAMLAALTGSISPSISGPAHADGFPSQAITMVVPFAAGGPSDVIARIVSEGMARTLKQSIVIENVGGAGGTTGTGRVAAAKPDGYTLLAASMGSHVAAPVLYQHLKYDTTTDFVPVALISHAPAVIVARKSLPANSLKEFIAYLKANPNTISQGHGGVGASSHMACLLFNAEIGAKVNVVSYRGSAPALNDVVAGQIDYLCEQTMGVAEQVNAGTVKAFAVASNERLGVMPSVPTSKEGGMPRYQLSIWSAIFAPKGTPPEVIALLNVAANSALEDPTVVKRVQALGGTVPVKAERTVAYLGELATKDAQRWEPILRKAAAAGADKEAPVKK